MQGFQQFLETGSKLKDLKKVQKAKKKGNFGIEVEEDEIDEISPAARRKRNAAHLKKTMAKYRVARELGMKAADVNQRRNTPTLKKR